MNKLAHSAAMMTHYLKHATDPVVTGGTGVFEQILMVTALPVDNSADNNYSTMNL